MLAPSFKEVAAALLKEVAAALLIAGGGRGA